MNNNDQYTGKWCWADGGAEDYTAICDTEAQAHAEAKAYMNDQNAAGTECRYDIGRCVHPLDLVGPLALARHIQGLIGGLCETAHDECGGDDPAIEIGHVELVPLGAMVMQFLREHASAARFGVNQVTTHTYVVGSP